MTEDEVTVAQRKLSLLLDRNEGEPQDFTEEGTYNIRVEMHANDWPSALGW